MSRVVVFDLDNRSMGQFDAKCNRGYAVYGNPGVQGSGQTTIQIPDSVAAEPWLQLGRLVLVQKPPLPAWAGVIDTPWKVTSPVELTIYGAEYLFSIRSPEQSIKFIKPLHLLVGEMIKIMNLQEQMYLALGDVTGQQVVHELTLDRKTMWDNLIPLLERTGYEMIMRPQVIEKRLYIYTDIGTELGSDTGFLLQDGDRANMKVVDGKITGKVLNRLVGISGKSTAESQIQTAILEDEESQGIYRTRSATLQFQNVTQISTLTDYTQTSLDQSKQPYLDLTISVSDSPGAFANMQPGNRLLLHTSKIKLPGGVRGWRGTVRILAMAYDEDNNTILANVRGLL